MTDTWNVIKTGSQQSPPKCWSSFVIIGCLTSLCFFGFDVSFIFVLCSLLMWKWSNDVTIRHSSLLHSSRNTSFQHAHTSLVVSLHLSDLLCRLWIFHLRSLSLNFVDSFTWTWNLSLNFCFALIVVENFSLNLWCTYEHVETGVRMVAASKQLAIIQPVLTGTELEFVNSIVWRLPLTHTLAVPNRIPPKELSLTYISISTLGESLGINPRL